MTNEAIIGRFFQMLDILKTAGVIRGVATFCNRYGIDRRNLYQLDHDRTRRFEVEWLAHLVVDYSVSAEWLLLGSGAKFSHPKLVNCPQKIRSILVNRLNTTDCKPR